VGIALTRVGELLVLVWLGSKGGVDSSGDLASSCKVLECKGKSRVFARTDVEISRPRVGTGKGFDDGTSLHYCFRHLS